MSAAAGERPGWNKELWQIQLLGSGLYEGVITTGLALSTQADGQGAAVVTLARLAEISVCNVSTAYIRKQKLIIAGFVARAGQERPGIHGGPVNRYQLVMPVTVDVGQYLSGPMGGGYA